MDKKYTASMDKLLDKLFIYGKEKERDKKLIKELRELLKMQAQRIKKTEKIIEEFGLTEHLKGHTYS